MPEYTTRKFVTLLSGFVILGILVLTLTPLALNRLLPTTMAYYQISTNLQGEASPTPWARLNHTLVITSNKVESYLVASAVMEPDPSPSNVTIQILFEPFDFDPANNLVPAIAGGILKWSGEMHQGNTVTITTSLELPSDGRYFIGSSAVSSAPWGSMGGAATRYYVQTRNGEAVSVYNTIEPSGQSQVELEAKCLANC